MMVVLFQSFGRAIRDLFQLKVVWIIVWPMLLAMLIWSILGLVFWDNVTHWLSMLLEWGNVQSWVDAEQHPWLMTLLRSLLYLLVFVPLVFTTALILTAFFVMPALARMVEQRYYPGMERKSGGTILGNVLNALLALALFIAIWLITLPLWLIGLGVLVPFFAATYLNQRLFRYDALTDHASAEEMQHLFKQYRWSWWGLGMMTGALQFVPFVNLLAPIITAMAFVHFALAILASHRSEMPLSVKM